ncbi:hypothetical protein BDF20DRAFT_815210 [Mycotypha africana]|uniref:uncharacterized protein n=1 Tax=Mycotypha africana TaxID=64632 RepID=UPI002300C856|nr:uncharacterized protein BDF20DRAFT_815210 [Mycotypha africana]KAI8988364.1 hypothetical protein BDF20DRAFT_815210 [Mycotypha africana]
MKKFASGITAAVNSPIPTSLSGECKKATKILNSFIDPGQGLDKMIPDKILEKAHGLAIYTVIKAGFLFSGRVGSGIVVARLPDGGWSAPSAIATGGIGAGGQIGAELTDFVLVLNTQEAVKTFSQVGNVTLGGNVSVAAGPVGRNAEASGSANLKHIAAVYSYSRTRGLFAGVSLEGSVVVSRGDANEKFYGQKVSAKELLTGVIPPPPEADSLYRALNAKFHSLGSQTYSRAGEGDSRSLASSVGRHTSSFKSANISAPGTLRQPPPPRSSGGLPASSHLPPPTYQANIPPAYTSSMGAANSIASQAAAKRAPPPPPPPSRKPTIPKPTMAKALYAFDGQEQGDLSFKEGDMITIVQKSESQDDWWTGKCNGKQGMFPANYVELF